MKKIILLATLLLWQIMSATMLLAQSAAIKKAAQSVFTLTTFRADGSIHSSTHGVFVGNDGEGIALWHVFDGAQRAVVVDAKGRSHDVDVMIGASELYDLCAFRIREHTATGLAMPQGDAPVSVGYIVGYDIKKPSLKKVTPQRSEKFMTTNNYYVFDDTKVSSADLGCPFVNEQGQLLGIMQRGKNGGQAFSADARLIKSFALSGLSINDASLRATGIRTALPADEQQATIMLMLASQADSTRYDAYIDDFVSQFPASAEGYKVKANRYIAQRNLDMADKTLALGVKNATKKDEAYYNYALAIYNASVYRLDSTFTRWNLDRALELSQEAYKVSPQPGYRHLQAQTVYAKGDYQQALNLFTELQQTDLGKHGEVYYEAAQCKVQLKAPQEEVMKLVDRAVEVQPGPASAPYVLARGQIYDQAGEYRKAFTDYLRYDTLVNNRGSYAFYYTKFKCEMKLRQYQLALNDIAHAIVLNPQEPTYYAEMASLQLQVSQFEDAAKTCDLALRLTDQYADLYIIKGIAQCEMKQKADGLATLQKAQELGDSRAAALIAKYSKK
jgi:hypothetical protein